MTDVLFYITTFLLQTVTVLFIARFLLQACRVDFYNPISQGIVKITDPVLKPMRLALPGYRNIDFASFLAAVLTQIIFFYAIAAILGQFPGTALQVIVNSSIRVLSFIVTGMWWAILIMIIASFLAIQKYRKLLFENYSDANTFHFRWMFQLLLLYSLTIWSNRRWCLVCMYDLLHCYFILNQLKLSS